MDSQLVAQFKELETKVIENETLLSELVGRLKSETETRDKLMSKLSKDYKIKNVSELTKAIEKLASAVQEKMNALSNILNS